MSVELLELCGREDLGNEAQDLLGRETLVVDRLQPAVNAQRRGSTSLDVQIRRTALHDGAQKGIHGHAKAPQGEKVGRS